MPGAKGSGGKRAGAGRPLASITIRQDTSLMISQVYPYGTADLGRGKAQVRRAKGGGRMIVIEQTDGSEIRILVF
jgi:hypothetical protein